MRSKPKALVQASKPIKWEFLHYRKVMSQEVPIKFIYKEESVIEKK